MGRRAGKIKDDAASSPCRSCDSAGSPTGLRAGIQEAPAATTPRALIPPPATTPGDRTNRACEARFHSLNMMRSFRQAVAWQDENGREAAGIKFNASRPLKQAHARGFAMRNGHASVNETVSRLPTASASRWLLRALENDTSRTAQAKDFVWFFASASGLYTCVISAALWIYTTTPVATGQSVALGRDPSC